MQLLDLLVEQTSHGYDRLRFSFVVDHWKVANVFLNHQPQGFVSGRADSNRLNGCCHYLFNPCFARVSSFQHNAQHHVPFGEDTLSAISIGHDDAANLCRCHRFNCFHNGRLTRNRYNRSAKKGHSFLPFLIYDRVSLKERGLKPATTLGIRCSPECDYPYSPEMSYPIRRKRVVPTCSRGL